MELEQEIKQTRPFRNQYHKAFVNIIYTGKWISQFASELLKQYNITQQQYNVLRIIKGTHPKSVSLLFIQERLLDKMSDVSRIVELLRKKGLISRKLNPENRRQVNIKITESGIELLKQIELENEKMDKSLSELNELEIEQLNFLLDKVRNSKTNQDI